MSTAALVPETWGLEGDDARQTLAHVGRRRLITDGFKRMRYSDGFSHARSLAFLGILLFVEGVIGAIGISRVLGSATFAKAIANALESILPGPAERVLENAAGQANQAASSGYWLAIAFGTIGALITGASLMGQIERALNRIYGIESDRDTLQKYGRAFLLALSAGVLSVVALGVLGLGAGFFSSFGAEGAAIYWSIARWPLGILLLIAAIALIFRWSPRRHQPRLVVDVVRRDRGRRAARGGHGRAQPLLPAQPDVRLDLRPPGGHHRPGVLGVRQLHRPAHRRRARRPARGGARRRVVAAQRLEDRRVGAGAARRCAGGSSAHRVTP